MHVSDHICILNPLCMLLLVQSSWNSMKVSMMIQEANTISSKLKKHYVFGRWVVTYPDYKAVLCFKPVGWRDFKESHFSKVSYVVLFFFFFCLLLLIGKSWYKRPQWHCLGVNEISTNNKNIFISRIILDILRIYRFLFWLKFLFILAPKIEICYSAVSPFLHSTF